MHRRKYSVVRPNFWAPLAFILVVLGGILLVFHLTKPSGPPVRETLRVLDAMTSCQACVWADCVADGTRSIDLCRTSAREVCEQVGCHVLGDIDNCTTFADHCKAGSQ